MEGDANAGFRHSVTRWDWSSNFPHFWTEPALAQAGCRAKVTKIYLQFVLRLSNLSTREFQFEVVGHQFRVSPTANVLPAVIFDSIRRLLSSSSRRKERVVSPQNLF